MSEETAIPEINGPTGEVVVYEAPDGRAQVEVVVGGRPVTSYSLDVISSVGYRVKSTRCTQFRTWANGVLRDPLLRGYTLNEKESPRADALGRGGLHLPVSHGRLQ